MNHRTTKEDSKTQRVGLNETIIDFFKKKIKQEYSFTECENSNNNIIATKN